MSKLTVDSPIACRPVVYSFEYAGLQDGIVLRKLHSLSLNLELQCNHEIDRVAQCIDGHICETHWGDLKRH